MNKVKLLGFELKTQKGEFYRLPKQTSTNYIVFQNTVEPAIIVGPTEDDEMLRSLAKDGHITIKAIETVKGVREVGDVIDGKTLHEIKVTDKGYMCVWKGNKEEEKPFSVTTSFGTVVTEDENYYLVHLDSGTIHRAKGVTGTLKKHSEDLRFEIGKDKDEAEYMSALLVRHLSTDKVLKILAKYRIRYDEELVRDLLPEDYKNQIS